MTNYETTSSGDHITIETVNVYANERAGGEAAYEGFEEKFKRNRRKRG